VVAPEANAPGLCPRNLGSAYARVDQVEKAAASLQQALRIGQYLKDPQIVESATAALEKVRGAGKT
jgi:hypothetical protein